jgi:type II secretory pathway component PulF
MSMASASAVRRYVAEVSRRLVALLDESVAPAKAVQILVDETILPAQSSEEPALPLSSAIKSIIPKPGAIPNSAASIADYVRACELQGRGASALKLLGRLKIKRAQGRTSLATIGIEFVLLTLVLSIHSIFVLPQFKSMFDAAGTPMPMFTRIVFAAIGPSGPFIGIVVLVLFFLILWRIFPFLIGPLLRPIDRLLLALPLIGSTIRQHNSDRISGWLGFAAPDAPSQKAAIEAARAWFRGNLLSRECAEVLRAANGGKDITACLAEARGFDREFRTVVLISDRTDSLAALRARWRVADTLMEQRSAIAPALAQIILGILVGAVVVSLYLPIFKISSLM